MECPGSFPGEGVVFGMWIFGNFWSFCFLSFLSFLSLVPWVSAFGILAQSRPLGRSAWGCFV